MLALITSQKSKSSYKHMTDGGWSSRGAARAVFSDTDVQCIKLATLTSTKLT